MSDRRVYVSADIEGITGIVHQEESSPRSPHRGEYEASRRAMAADVNAAIVGACAGGATAALVNDSHATMRNLLPDLLDERATLIRGLIKPSCMLEGISAEYECVFLVGYHARAGVADGVLSHTLDGGQVRAVRVDGNEVGELALAGWLAGSRGVPIAMVTGDAATCREAVELLGTDLITVETKRALDRIAAVCPPPAVVRRGIEAAARRAMAHPSQHVLLAPPATFDVEIDWRSTTAAAVGSWIPGVDLTADGTTAFSSSDIHEAIALIQVMLLAANAATGTS